MSFDAVSPARSGAQTGAAETAVIRPHPTLVRVPPSRTSETPESDRSLEWESLRQASSRAAFRGLMFTSALRISSPEPHPVRQVEVRPFGTTFAPSGPAARWRLREAQIVPAGDHELAGLSARPRLRPTKEVLALVHLPPLVTRGVLVELGD